MTRLRSLVLGAALSLLASCALAQTEWNSRILKQDTGWYATPEASAIADSVILYQSAEGGFPKNTDLAAPPTGPLDADVANTIDNDGTTLPMQFLARVIEARGETETAAYRAAFLKALDYLLASQSPNGGFPQFYPRRGGYYDRITYNDDAMARVLTLLRTISSDGAHYAFVDPARKARAAEAVARGTELILKTQIVQNGAPTVWCAQHDEVTLAPAWARRFEPPSLSGNESAGLVRFLMAIPDPDPEVVAAIEGAVAWYRQTAIPHLRIDNAPGADGLPDRRVVADPAAGPLWARFYELETNRPIFMGRDSVVRYDFAEIERERRVGYNYYGDWGARLIAVDYPAWRARVGRS
ncbi:pectate lyase [Brevundimonas sp. LM2]|uniref:pectate lyase n=1 Tax=Brevundimonas sp. LM2 TaxID=1938605 RepID=UPI00098408C3|nr:pectate lyase [Brevundimonas sp. LM2]AQR61915.1 pectate lyase [Brevundimonas sp. LM2]